MLAVNPVNSQSFKGVYVVRVAKNAFKNPENMNACKAQVEEALNGVSSSDSLVETLKRAFADRKNIQYSIVPNGILMDAPNKEGMHTFSALTEDVLKYLFGGLSLKDMLSVVKVTRNPGVTSYSSSLQELLGNVFKQMKSTLAKKPVNKEIEVNNLEQLAEYAGKLK